jgi:hypothetical protein
MVRAVAVVLAVAGVFWTGRESTHGINALWENWWCPLPLVAIVVGILLLVLLMLPRRASAS